MFSHIIGKMISRGVINEEDYEIYLYGLKSLLFLMSFFVISLIISISMGKIYIYFITIIFGMSLRRNLGGLHFSKPYLCFIFSLMYVVIPMWICDHIDSISCRKIYILLIIVDIILFTGTLRFGICKHKNKIYTANLIKKSRNMAITIEIIIALVSSITFIFQNKIILFVVLYVLVIQTFSYYILVKRKLHIK